MTSKE